MQTHGCALWFPRLTAALAGAALAVALGCAGPKEDPYAPRTPEVTVGSPSATASPAAQPRADDTASPGENESPPVPVEAMVGQIAGRPIFAHRVLEGLEPELESLGRRLPAADFRQRAFELIYGRVREDIQNALISDAAARDLAPQQLLGLDFYIASQREELLRRFGRGSLALAERNLLDQTGLTLDQTLREIRIETMINIYLERNLKPLVNVSRRDIERYYRDNYDTFNPPTKRRVGLIYAADDADAAWFRQQLDDGKRFAELAADARNAYRGKAATLPLEGDSMFGGNIDPTLQGLGVGAWAGPLPHRGQQWFVHVAELEEPPRRTLFDAQVDIERELRFRQDFELRDELGRKLRADASGIDDERQMAEAVLEIAVARYASP